jgi:hypothetical protein
MFVVLLPIAYEDIIFVSVNYAGHNIYILLHNNLYCAYSLNKIKQLMLVTILLVPFQIVLFESGEWLF